MRINRYILIKNILPLILLFLMSCASESPKKTEIPAEASDSLKKFLDLCVSDMNKAKKVIFDNDLVKNLSHLQTMDSGGQKYYLLERESITKMIQSVTEGMYSDYILINKMGLVIYTMNNDSYFGKSVKTSLKNSALNLCFQNHNMELFLEDTFLTFEREHERLLYISSSVQGGNSLPGILILLVDPMKVLKNAGEKAVILNSKGDCLISADPSDIGQPFKYLDKINLNPEYNTEFKVSAGRIKFSYRFFKYHNIEWVIVNLS